MKLSSHKKIASIYLARGVECNIIYFCKKLGAMNLLQIQASDPEFSTWVAASAGTGKTKILTDRVLRLLLKMQSLIKYYA